MRNGVGRSTVVEEVSWAVEAVARRIPRTTCLCQALVAEALLLRRGCAATLRIGVRRSAEGKFQAHAWVESEGRVALGGEAGPKNFKPLESSARMPRP